jgi:hypothetical protein
VELNKFLNDRKCPDCGNKKRVEKRRHSMEYLKSYYKKHECILLSNIYENNKTQLEFLCHCGNTHISTFDTFKKSHRCRDCWKKSITGEFNPKYNPTLTDAEREYKRVSVDYSQWRIAVFKRDNFACVNCGVSGVYLQAHHLDGFHWCVDKRYDVSNGATLCVSCHDNFHTMYGRHNNTKAQFDEWMRGGTKKIV